MLAGASAGGGGVANNADFLGDLLRANRACPECLEYRALLDSTFGPDGTGLDWTTSTPCLNQALCTWQQLVEAGSTMFTRRGDVSCDTWHAETDPTNAWQCDSTDHTIRHHITTPMMVRMGLNDQLISANAIESGVSVPGRGVMTLPLFIDRVRTEMRDHGRLLGAEEAAAMTTPALFGPMCEKHETISNNTSVYGVTIGVGGVRQTMFDIFTNWRAGGSPIAAIQPSGDLIDCQ